MAEGHHFGVLAISVKSNGSFGYMDSGEALGERGRILGGRVELCADHGYSVYAGKGMGGEDAGTDSLRFGGGGRSPAPNTGEEKGLGLVVLERAGDT